MEASEWITAALSGQSRSIPREQNRTTERCCSTPSRGPGIGPIVNGQSNLWPSGTAVRWLTSAGERDSLSVSCWSTRVRAEE